MSKYQVSRASKALVTAGFINTKTKKSEFYQYAPTVHYQANTEIIGKALVSLLEMDSEETSLLESKETELSESEETSLSLYTETIAEKKDISPSGEPITEPQKEASPEPVQSDVVKPSNWKDVWGATKDALGFPDGSSLTHIGKYAKFLIGNPKGDLTGEWKAHAITPPMDSDEITRFGAWWDTNYEGLDKPRSAGKINEYVAKFRSEADDETDLISIYFSNHMTLAPDEVDQSPKWGEAS